MSDASAPAPPTTSASGKTGEMAAAILVTLVGIVMTTYAAFNHVGPLLAPGSALSLLGGAWLGNVLARRDVRLFGWLATRARRDSSDASGEGR